MDDLVSSVLYWQGSSLFDPEASSRLASAKFDSSKMVSVHEQIASSLKIIGMCENLEAGVADKQELSLCYRGFVVTPASLPTCFQITGSNGTLFNLRMEPKPTPLGPQSKLTLRECRVIDANTSKMMMRVHEYHLKGINTHCYALVFSDVQDEKLGQAMQEFTVEADANNCHRYLANANACDVSLGLLFDERRDPVSDTNIAAEALSSLGTLYSPISRTIESPQAGGAHFPRYFQQQQYQHPQQQHHQQQQQQYNQQPPGYAQYQLQQQRQQLQQQKEQFLLQQLSMSHSTVGSSDTGKRNDPMSASGDPSVGSKSWKNGLGPA